MKSWIRLITAYLITFAVYNIGGFESTDILMGALFVATYMLLGLLPDGRKGPAEIMQDSLYSQIRKDSGVDDADRRKLIKLARIVTVIWTLLYVIYLGGRINRDLDNPLFSGIYILLTVAGLYIILYYSLGSILNNTFRIKEAEVNSAGFSWKIWAIYAGIIFACMLPLFLLNFPGTMTVDSFDQLNQARGLTAYSDHHPWVHTLIIQALYSLGYAATESVNIGIATYTLIQMVIMAISVAYAIASLSEVGANRTCRVLMLLGFILYPYNLAYSITMWKDILFAATVLVLTVTVYRVFVVRSGYSVRDIILLLISGLGMCLLRHNGLYAYILTMVIILIYELIKKKRSAVFTSLAIVVGTLMAVALVRGPIQKANGVEAGDFAHNIPIPLQQVGRVVYDRCKLTDEEIESISKINTFEFIWEEYTPGGADPMIQWVMFGDTEYLLSHKEEYVFLWLRLGVKHPEEYIRAYIDQTKGYYTTMAPEQTEYYGILPNEDGLETAPVLGAGVRIKINEICEKLHKMIPVYGILYSMGACLMLLILGVVVVVLQDKKVKILTYLPVLTLTFTLLVATPLCADLRYAYPLMLCMPMLICITLKGPCHE